jgi:hypothetical protein
MSIEDINISHVVINEHGPMFADFIDFLTDCLQICGLRVSRTVSVLHPGRLNLIVGHTIFLPQEVLARIRTQTSNYIVFQLEALNKATGFFPDYSTYVELLRGARQVWDYAPKNVEFLAQCGLNSVHYIPIGFSSRLERISRADKLDIDVLFFGIINDRRTRVIEEIRSRGFNAGPIFAYGSARDAMIARSKIQLNIHQFELSHLEQLRISYLLNNKRFVISENSEHNLYGEGVVFCDYGEIADCCADYLKAGMDTERIRIAQLGYDSLRRIDTVSFIKSALERLTTL